MKVRLHAHAQDRLQERGAADEEVIATIERGERFGAKHGRTGFRCNFAFHGEWSNSRTVSRTTPSPLTGEGWDGGENIALAARSTPTLTLPRRGGGNRYFLTQ